MRSTSACTTARCSVPRGLDSTTASSSLVLDLLVAFEGDAVEHRRLVQMHDQPFAGALDRDLVEQAGRQQRLERRVARGFVEAPVGRGMEIGAHGLGVDAAIALDLDGSRRAGRARWRGEQPERAAISSAPATTSRPAASPPRPAPLDCHVITSRLSPIRPAPIEVRRAGRNNVWR